MKNILIAVSLLFVSLPAVAGGVDCYNQACLKYGWQVRGPLYAADLKCHQNNCRRNGWDMIDNFADVSAVCRNHGDCLIDGWITYSRTTGEYEGIATCIDHDCLHGGWVYETVLGFVTRLDCKKRDCIHEGYRIVIPGGLGYDATCRDGKCLSNGCSLQLF